VQLAVRMLYVQSLLLAQRPLRASELETLNDGLAALIDRSLPKSSGSWN
jgi:hypothetical protein